MSGIAEPLVLLPGLMADARVFRAQIEPLSRHRPVTVAPITSGERVEEIASDLMSRLPQRFALGGHGLGGVVAMELLRRAPERVTRIAVLSCTPLPETPQEAAAREPRLIRARAGKMAEALDEEFPVSAFAKSPARQTHRATQLAMAKELGAACYARQIRALQRRKDQQATLRRCRVPALVLGGALDPLIPEKRLRFLAELIPHAKLALIPDAGHLPMLEAPEAVTEALETWLAAPLVLR
ncbi:alpha/beta fold hydrolase [Litorisediminicola beolgyonensis]|uniref:Alpha/beta fold hydrolase n=1 Tax=Litorisediminicola beolgyonensis TaxID=1173614 RepID=A0ABW3ZH51_9RHOB